MDTDAVLTLLQETAAAVITPRFRALLEGEVVEKGPGDLVTVADREAEVLIADALQAAYPDALVVGEEATAADPALLVRFADAEHSFTVDPVDGTKNFVAGSPDHAVMAAELRGGEVIRSWIWQPAHRLAYVAERGAGAWRNGERMERLNPSEDPGALRGASSQRRFRREPQGALAPVREPWWCCGVDYPRIAEGEIDYLVYRADWPWDHAPGSLLVAEVGGRSGRTDGSSYDPRARRPWLLTAASPAAYETVRTELAPAFSR